MGKQLTLLAMLSITILLFHFAGLIGDTPMSWLLDLLINPENMSEHSFFSELSGILLAFGGLAAITIGTLIPQKAERVATIVFAGLLFVIGWDMISIFNIIKQSNLMLAIMIIAPMLFLYLFVVLEWWRGKD